MMMILWFHKLVAKKVSVSEKEKLAVPAIAESDFPFKQSAAV